MAVSAVFSGKFTVAKLAGVLGLWTYHARHLGCCGSYGNCDPSVYCDDLVRDAQAQSVTGDTPKEVIAYDITK